MWNDQQDLLDLRLAEQSLMAQSLADKDARIRELEAEVRYLRRLSNDILASPKLQPSRSPMPVVSGHGVPNRWRT